jgi:hypothetical protein
LREPIRAVQEEHLKRFAGKALPLGHAEDAAFGQVCNLWAALLRAYRRLSRAALSGKRPDLKKALALLCHRAIDCADELLYAHFMARRECSADLWQSLYEIYALAETHDAALASVQDGPGATNCTIAVVRPLMLALAHPFGLPPRELAWTRRWIQRWAPKVQVTREPAEGYGFDLSGHAGVGWLKAEHQGDSVRRLDFVAVGPSIKNRLRKLEEGAQPAELGLGQDCMQPVAGELLQALAHAWLGGPQAREFQRRNAAAATEMITGFAAIHHALNGGTSDSSAASPWDYTRRDADQIHVFQHAAARQADRAHEGAAEVWDTLDESAIGSRLRRKAPGTRVSLRQLVALRSQGAQMFILSEVRWLSQGPDQTLTVGTQALPGLARACSVRSTSSAREEPFSQAFLLPVGSGVPASLVLPAGWYQQARALELQADGQPTRVKLFELLARGFDYDCANFSEGA